MYAVSYTCAMLISEVCHEVEHRSKSLLISVFFICLSCYGSSSTGDSVNSCCTLHDCTLEGLDLQSIGSDYNQPRSDSEDHGYIKDRVCKCTSCNLLNWKSACSFGNFTTSAQAETMWFSSWNPEHLEAETNLAAFFTRWWFSVHVEHFIGACTSWIREGELWIRMQ